MLRIVARALPPTTRRALAKIRDGLRELTDPPVPSMSASEAAPARPRVEPPAALTVEGLASLLRAADALDVDVDRDAIDSLFNQASLRPELFRLLDLAYCQRSFADSRTCQRLTAARLLGSGQADQAHMMLRRIADSSGSLFDFIMAARCLMRPAGREGGLLEYMRSGGKRFGREYLYYLNLATCYFVCGDTAAANAILDRHRPEWEPVLGVGSAENRRLETELSAAVANRTILRSTHYDQTIYDESGIWAHWAPYYADMNLDSPALMFGWLRRAYARYIEDVFVRDPGVTTLVDFGVMCAQPHADVGRQWPGRRIVGIDRQAATAQLNRAAYGDLENLEFVADDIENYFVQRDLTGAALFHARTATLCYPDKIRRLYQMARAAGMRRIVLFENMALSRSAGRFLDYSDFVEDAVTFKNFQFIHNYRGMLEEAGYVVERETRLFSPLVSPFSLDDVCSTHVHLVASARTP